MWKDIHILLLGEPKVGKTSLILALVSEEFPEDVPNRVEEITIPADVTPEKVPTYIADYCEDEQEEYQLCEEIGRANVICLVYDLADLSTLTQVQYRWLPLIREYSLHESVAPIILVGTKSDLIADSKMHEAMPIMTEFPEVETCIECSAKTLNNVSEMFYFAQKAVLHPTGPLYSPHDGYLKPESRMALTRIFKLCDADNDGVLSDDELNHFQTICFSTPLAAQALQDVKSVVSKNCADGVVNDCLTLAGFLYLHLLFIQRGRHETTWAVLRKFGYSDALALQDDYLVPLDAAQHQQLSGGDTVPQLSANGLQFLTEVFRKYDRDKDGALNQPELLDLFGVFPYEPWGHDVLNTVHTDAAGAVTLVGFLSQWQLTTYLDVPRTLEHLGYLGYSTLRGGGVTTLDAVSSVSPHAGPHRDVYTCKVIGARGTGKSAFLQAALERRAGRKSASVLAINRVRVDSRDVYLLLHEVDVADLMAAGEGVFVCDVVCLLYDVTDPDSFQPCVEAHRKFVAEHVACAVVAAKSDAKPTRQRCAVQPAEFCAAHGLPPPVCFSVDDDHHRAVYETIAALAARPIGDRKGGSAGADRSSAIGVCLKWGAVVGLFAVIAFGAYKYVDFNKARLRLRL